MKILLIEEDTILKEIMEDYLISLNYEVETRYKCLDEIDGIFKDSYDLLILDVGVPRLNGFKILGEIKNKNITTLFITSFNLADYSKEVFTLDYNDYIKKPFELKDLAVRINIIKKTKKIDIDIKDKFK